MKKIIIILFAALCAAAVIAQTMQIWSNNQPVHQQSVENVDSILFITSAVSDNIPTSDKVCKTWTYQYYSSQYSWGMTFNLTLREDNTFSYSEIYTDSGSNKNASGTYLVQGNLILACATAGDAVAVPLVWVYNEGALYVDIDERGQYKLE